MTQNPGTQWSLISLTLAFLSVAVLFVLFRFWARHTTAATFGADDWFIMAGLLVSLASGALNTIMLYDGLGKNASSAPDSAVTQFLRILLAWEVLYTTAVALIKASILCFYLRLFPSRRFRITTYVVGSTVVAWWLACSIISIFQCAPVSRFWTPESPGTCMTMKMIFLINAVPNVVQNVVILLMPVDQILGLQATRVQKARLYITFGIGGFVLIASVYRFKPIMAHDFGDENNTLAVACSWSVVETASGVICACLPTLRPLVKMTTTKMNMVIKSRALTVHRPGTEYIAMGDSHCGSGSMAKPAPAQTRPGTSREGNYMYPGEEELSSPQRSGFESHPAVAPTIPEEPKRVSIRHAEDEIVIETEITVSVADIDSVREEPLRPWQIVKTKPGRVM